MFQFSFGSESEDIGYFIFFYRATRLQKRSQIVTNSVIY